MSKTVTATRVYECRVGETTRLVRAQNRVQALNHVARSMISVTIAGQDALIDAVSKGVAVEVADTREDTETREIDFNATAQG